MSQVMQAGNVRPSLNEAGKRRIVQVLFSLLLFGGLLFASAGRLDWWAAWVYLAVYVGIVALNALIAFRRNLDVINERGRPGPNVKGWDKVLTSLMTVFGIATYVVAGLDAGRYGWSVMLPGIQIAGFVLTVAGLLVGVWVMAVNAFLSTRVRIQEDRGHQVVTTGPYRFVRHPMYAGTIVTFIGTPLLLGSWWALVPNGVVILLLIVRTGLEDRTLQAELPGYKEYTQKTRYRLLPGVW